MIASPDLSAAWLRPGMVVSSHTVPWPQTNLLAFLRRAKGLQRFFWESDRALSSFAAFGAAAELSGSGPARFRQIREQAESLYKRTRVTAAPDVPSGQIFPRLVGGFSFRPANPEPTNGRPSVWAHFSQAYFVLPKYMLTVHEGATYLTVNTVSPDADEWAAHEALWELPAPLDMPVLEDMPEAVNPADLMPEQDWHRHVLAATGDIRAGQLSKIVLARAREFPAISNPITALVRLAGRYPDCYRFLIEPAPGRAFFGASPELLASVSGERVETMALAGSIRRGTTLEEDAGLGESLLASAKERQEHQFVVRAIADRLAPLLKNVEIHETGLLQLSNIQHICTPISGRRKADAAILDLVEALHPTPAVGGLPSEAGLAFIEHAEPVSRGWYAAPVGWMDADGRGEFVVALRSAVTDGDRTRLYAGAGIVAESDPAREWQETELKFRPMMEAVGCLV